MALKIAVLGAGPGGYSAALRASQLGADVTIIEKDNLGGTCLNRGCIPSKIMKTSAELLEKFKKASDFGITAKGEIVPDIKLLMERKEKIIQTHINALNTLMQDNNIEIIKGEGFIKEGFIDVKDDAGTTIQSVKWDKLIIATGTSPFSFKNMPFDHKQIISSDDILNLQEIPESLLIVGAGIIGCEFACIMSALGTKVSILEMLPRLLPFPFIDEDSTKILEREMKKRKIKVLTGKTLTDANISDKIEAVIYESSDSEKKSTPIKMKPITIKVDKILVCVGRKPNISKDDFKEFKDKVKLDEGGWIITDEYMKTTMENVFAVGDILGPSKSMLAYVATKEGIIAAENAFGASKKMNYKAIPKAIFTMPEVASVGITEKEADLKIEARADTVLYRAVGKAHVLGEIAGQAKIISDIKTGIVLGVHIVGAYATELIAEGTLAVNTKRTVKELANTFHAHPTMSEVLFEAAYKAQF
jgi:dihydrolipoamide dehydrogenase